MPEFQAETDPGFQEDMMEIGPETSAAWGQAQDYAAENNLTAVLVQPDAGDKAIHYQPEIAYLDQEGNQVFPKDAPSMDSDTTQTSKLPGIDFEQFAQRYESAALIPPGETSSSFNEKGRCMSREELEKRLEGNLSPETDQKTRDVLNNMFGGIADDFCAPRR